jgi:hypothetical protein
MWPESLFSALEDFKSSFRMIVYHHSTKGFGSYTAVECHSPTMAAFTGFLTPQYAVARIFGAEETMTLNR